MLSDTFLVMVLVKAGLSPKHAAAFERALDDRPICGISAVRLAEVIAAHDMHQMAFATHMCEDLRRRLKDAEQQRDSAREVLNNSLFS